MHTMSIRGNSEIEQGIGRYLLGPIHEKGEHLLEKMGSMSMLACVPIVSRQVECPNQVKYILCLFFENKGYWTGNIDSSIVGCKLWEVTFNLANNAILVIWLYIFEALSLSNYGNGCLNTVCPKMLTVLSDGLKYVVLLVFGLIVCYCLYFWQ